MNRINQLIVAMSIATLSFTIAHGQDLKSPTGYLSYMGEKYQIIAKDQWDYIKAVGRGKSARKVDKRRQELARTILDSKRQIARMPGFDGDKTLRDSIINFMHISYLVVNEDYAKIVNMEEIAEQSYDAMEAYLLAKEQASEKQALASEKVSRSQNAFAAKYNINFIEPKDKLSNKLREAGEVFKYYNQVYLIFFKSYKQEGYLLDALNSQDINAIEQNRSALLNYSKQGREELKKYSVFKGDQGLSTICRQMLQFYSDEAENRMPIMVEYYIQNEKFNEIKVAFDKIKPSKRTQADIDKYNKGINDLNAAGDAFNKVNEQLNERRSKLLKQWNDKVQSFLNKHTP